MNNIYSYTFFRARRFVTFLCRAKTRYKVHSPYVFRYISEVIRPGSPRYLCAPVEELRQSLLKDKRIVQKTDFGSGGQGTHPIKLRCLTRSSSLPAYRAARLFHLAQFLQADRILELGTALGISAGYLGKSRPEARVVSLEGCPAQAALAREHMDALGLNNVEVVEGEFDQTLEQVLSGFEKLDLVFFDGNHRLEPTLKYFRQCLPLAHNDSVFVFDDIHHSPEMETAWKTIIAHPGVTTSIDLFYTGVVFFRKELTRQDFILRYP